MNTYLIGWLMFMAFYTGVYTDKKVSNKIIVIILIVSMFWPIALIYAVLEKPVSRLMKGAK